MAIYHLSVKTISRSAGRSATAAAAYRSGVSITDERTGEIHDYTRKGGVIHRQLVVPLNAPKWADDRSALWNAAEQAERRKNSTVAREIVVALPAELSASRRRTLAVMLAHELVKRHGCAADVAIHAPSAAGDDRNHHAHILLTTRRLTPAGFGEKTRELDDRTTREVDHWRERWATLANSVLASAGQEARIDHRSLVAQGISDRLPTVHLGPAASAMERRGVPSRVAAEAQRQAAEVLAQAQAAAAIEQARQASIRALEIQLQEAREAKQNQQEAQQKQQREADDRVRAAALADLGRDVQAASRAVQVAGANIEHAAAALPAAGANIGRVGTALRASAGDINASGRELSTGRRHAADPKRDPARVAAAVRGFRRARSVSKTFAAVGAALGRAVRILQDIGRAGQGILKIVRQKAQKRAMAAFLEQWKGVAPATREEALYGVPVAMHGRHVVLHVGRRRHVLHQVPDGEPAPELGVSADQSRRRRGPGLSR